jgi:hypothetical protein
LASVEGGSGGGNAAGVKQNKLKRKKKMKTKITKQVCLNGSYGITKPRPKGVQSHLIEVWHLDGKHYATRAQAIAAVREGKAAQS